MPMALVDAGFSATMTVGGTIGLSASLRTLAAGGHTWGVSKPVTRGGRTNSVYTHVRNGRAVQDAIYDANGDVIAHVDFKNHGPGAPSDHAHKFGRPGDPASGHRGAARHISPGDVAASWKKLPPGIEPYTPIGD